MAKFYGKVGYGEQQEIANGVWDDVIFERDYYGDVTRISRKFQEDSDQLNGNITVGNSISILADAYAYNHFFAIRYVKWAGVSWTVTNVEVKAPRLILRLGEVYNGPTPAASGTP